MTENLLISKDWLPKKSFPDEISSTHLWLIHIPSFDLKRTGCILSEAEINKAVAFHFLKDEKCYRVCRTVLRLLLGSYLDYMPDSIKFKLNDYGKPELADSSSASIFFNVSHSGEFGLIAFDKESSVGVDVELIQTIDHLNLADSVFSDIEKAELSKIPINLRSEAFYSGWTRKEAFIKAIGMGLSFALKEFNVSINPSVPESDVQIVPEYAGIFRQWKVVDISFNRQYRAAVAIEKDTHRFFEKFFFDI